MELGIKLSIIEDIKEDIQKCYNNLKRELKNNGNIAISKELSVMQTICLMMCNSNYMI